jgi:hypothetical protein
LHKLFTTPLEHFLINPHVESFVESRPLACWANASAVIADDNREHNNS